MFNQPMGILAWITDSEGTQLPEYQIKEIDDETMECWIPSTEGTNFEIKWRVVGDPQPGLDICAYLLLDGISMTGGIQRVSQIAEGAVGRLHQEYTGTSTARLYQFGKRILTDTDNRATLTMGLLENLNTIQVQFQWGHREKSTPRLVFHTPQEVGPIYERATKKGHAGSAELGKVVDAPAPLQAVFKAEQDIRPRIFIFRYGSKDWLRAQEIIPCSPPPDSPGARNGQKRARSSTQGTIDIDDLETDDDDRVAVTKQMAPAPTIPIKKRRMANDGPDVKPKLEPGH